MKKMKEAKEEKTKNELEMKICEHTKSIANTNCWVSQLKRVVFFRIKIERLSVCFFFFLFSAFSFFSSAFCYLYIEKISVSLSLPIYISSNKHEFS